MEFKIGDKLKIIDGGSQCCHPNMVGSISSKANKGYQNIVTCIKKIDGINWYLLDGYSNWITERGLEFVNATVSSLLEEAKKRYPIGTKFIPAHLTVQEVEDFCIVTNTNFSCKGDFIYSLTDENRTSSSHSEYGNSTYERIVYDGRNNNLWAKVIEELKPLPKFTVGNEIVVCGKKEDNGFGWKNQNGIYNPINDVANKKDTITDIVWDNNKKEYYYQCKELNTGLLAEHAISLVEESKSLWSVGEWVECVETNDGLEKGIGWELGKQLKITEVNKATSNKNKYVYFFENYSNGVYEHALVGIPDPSTSKLESITESEECPYKIGDYVTVIAEDCNDGHGRGNNSRSKIGHTFKVIKFTPSGNHKGYFWLYGEGNNGENKEEIISKLVVPITWEEVFISRQAKSFNSISKEIVPENECYKSPLKFDEKAFLNKPFNKPLTITIKKKKHEQAHIRI